VTATTTMDNGAGTYPRLDIDFNTPEMIADPWAVLEKVRAAGSLVWNERGYWMTAHDRVCRQILNRPDLFGQDGVMVEFFGPDAFISIDEKRAHNELRDVWVGNFSREAIAALAEYVRGVANDMLDKVVPELEAGNKVDIMAALCRPLPAYVIAYMMGVSDDNIPRVINWSDRMSEAATSGFPIDYDNDPYWLASERAKKELAAFLVDQFAYRRKNPGEDIISRLVNSEIGQRLTENAMVVNVRQLLFAGNETTAKWLGHIIHTLGDRSEDRKAIVADRALLPGALEEVMRWQGVVQMAPRGVTQKGTVVEGLEIEVGKQIFMLTGAANRDPTRFDRPADFDIRRESKPHLGFGFGLHTCLGAILARMEARVVMTALLDRIPNYRIAEPVKYGDFSLRGPTAVWIEFDKG
jgi:cytochrome P450